MVKYTLHSCPESKLEEWLFALPRSILTSILLSTAGWLGLQPGSSFSHQSRICAPSLWADQCWTQRESSRSGTRGINDPRDSPRLTRYCSKYFIEHFGGSKPPMKFSIEVLLTMCFRSCRWNDYQLTCSRIIFRTSLESSMPPFHGLNMAWPTIKGSQSPVFPCNGEYFQVFFSCTTHSALSVLFFFLPTLQLWSTSCYSPAHLNQIFLISPHSQIFLCSATRHFFFF